VKAGGTQSSGFLLGLFFDPKNETNCSDEIYVDLQRPTQPYIPVHRILHNHCCESSKSYTAYYIVMCMLTDPVFRNASVKFNFCSFNSDIEVTVSGQTLTELRFYNTGISVI
jgi:hypothetical protein